MVVGKMDWGELTEKRKDQVGGECKEEMKR